MIKVIGEVTLLITDENGKQNKITQNNIFTKRGYWGLILTSSGATSNNYSLSGKVFNSSSNLKISSSTIEADFNTVEIGDCIAQGETPIGVNAVKWVEKWDSETGDQYGELRSRFPASGSTRIFQTVVVGSSYNTTTKISSASAYVKFASPVTLGPTDTLDVFYRLYFKETGSYGLTLESPFIRIMGRKFFGLETDNWFISSTGDITLTSSITRYPTMPYLRFNSVPKKDLNNHSNTDSFRLTADYNALATDSRLIYLYLKTNTLLSFTGSILNSIAINSCTNYLPDGTGDLTLTAYQLADLNRTKIQTVWGKSSNAVSPFYDASFIATGTGKIVPSGTPTATYPTLYRVQISSSGNTDSATYYIQKQITTGYVENTYSYDTSISLYGGFNTNVPLFPDHHGYNSKYNIIKYSIKQVLTWDETGISIQNVMNGDYVNFDINNNTAYSNANLPVTALKTVELYNGYIYAACTDTGLWRIDPAGGNNSIINITNSPVFGMTKTNYGGIIELIIVTSNGISSSASNFTTFFNPSHSVISSAGYNNLILIEGSTHISDTDGLCCLLFKNGNDTPTIWWSRTIGNGSAISGFAGSLSSNNTVLSAYKAVQSSPFTSNTFVYHFVDQKFPRKGSFNSNTLTNPTGTTVTNIFNNIGTFISSGEFVIVTSSVNSPYIVNTSFTTRNSVSTNSSTSSNTPYKLVELDTNLLYGNGQFFMAKNVWTDYGWNGSSWVEGSTTPKTVSSSDQPIIDGLNIRFTEGSFVSGDYYTFMVCEGISGDNARHIQFWLAITSNETLPSSELVNLSQMNIPSSPPFQITVPTNNILCIESIIINNNQISDSQIRQSNTVPPNMGIVHYDPTSGVLYFHSGDAGKPILINYYSQV